MLPQNDIYLIYRIAHLVPLYQEYFEDIYKENKWIQSVLPNFPGKHVINIGLPITHGRTRCKKCVEWLFGGRRGKLIEFMIKMIRLPIVINKKNKLGPKGRGVIINKYMLKFHQDTRKRIHLLYEVYIKSYHK